MIKKYIVDFDDYCDNYNCLPQLLEIKKALPNFKATLFTIPLKISAKLEQETASYDWLQMAQHGLNHDDNYEFATLNYQTARRNIILGRSANFVRIFKAPGWQISEGTMKALRELSLAVAVQYSDGRLNGDPNGKYQPAVIEGLKYYAFREVSGEYEAIHGHTWECCDNGIYKLMPQILALPKDSEFIFVNNYVNQNFPVRPAAI